MIVNVPALITFIILVVAVILLLFNVTRPDLIALLVLISLGLTSTITPGDLFSGFSRSAVITVIALFIMTNVLYRTGVTRWMGEHLLQLGGTRPWRLTLTVMLAGAVLSYFMNTIAAGAVLLPAVIGLARATDIRPSQLLIPLSYGALLGGMATLLTTSSILVNAALRDANYPPFQLLDFLPVGGVMAAAGILFMTFIGRRWLPNRSPIDLYGWDARYQSGLSDLYGLQERLYEALIEPTSPLIGQSIALSRIGETLGLSILAMSWYVAKRFWLAVRAAATIRATFSESRVVSLNCLDHMCWPSISRSIRFGDATGWFDAPQAITFSSELDLL